ncbi:hypothetical protein ElyMa_006521300 [Elysia marginata]|uniref:Uncharacterized protein n=1 Tax=Elysia marginata TaxID=1093978 RepID=A0AAV4I6G0_9GAST|nr:hypothetical protein ElyMa_006521300 [Elysia marginata]
MPRIHAIETNEKTKDGAVTAPNTPSSQRKAKDHHRWDNARLSRTAPSTPSHHRHASEKAAKHGDVGSSGPWQVAGRRSFTSSPSRRHAASEARLGCSSPTRTAAFAAAATALAPSVVSSIRQKCESERTLPVEYALLAEASYRRYGGARDSVSLGGREYDGGREGRSSSPGSPHVTQSYRTFNSHEAVNGTPRYANLCNPSNKSSLAVPAWGLDPSACPTRGGPETHHGSRGMALPERSASFGADAQRRSYCDVMRGELGLSDGGSRGGVGRLLAQRSLGIGISPRGRSGRVGDLMCKDDEVGLWGRNTCSACGGLHFVSSISSPFLSSSAGGGARVPSPRRHLYSNLSPERFRYRSGSSSRGGIDNELYFSPQRHRALREFPDGYASEANMKYSQAAIRELEKEMESCPLCVSQAAKVATRNGSRGSSEKLSLDITGHAPVASRTSSVRSSAREDFGGPGPPRTGSLRSAPDSPTSSAYSHSYTGCRLQLHEGQQHQGRVTLTPIRTEGWAIPNNPRRVVCYEGLHSNCWVEVLPIKECPALREDPVVRRVDESGRAVTATGLDLTVAHWPGLSANTQ